MKNRALRGWSFKTEKIIFFGSSGTLGCVSGVGNDSGASGEVKMIKILIKGVKNVKFLILAGKSRNPLIIR